MWSWATHDALGSTAGGDQVERGPGGDQDAAFERGDVVDDGLLHPLGEVVGGELAEGHDLAADPPPHPAAQRVGRARRSRWSASAMTSVTRGSMANWGLSRRRTALTISTS